MDQILDPTIGASSKPPDMNMLAIDLDPLNPISSFLKTLNLEDSRSISMLSIIADTNLDLG